MSLRLAVLLAPGLLVTSLTCLNAGAVRVSIARDWRHDLPLAALAVGAFLVGASLAFVLDAVRDLARSYQNGQGSVDRCPSCRRWNTRRR